MMAASHRILSRTHRLLTDDDPELQAMALDDYGEAVKEAAHAHGALMSSMAPRDPIDDGNAVLEVR